MRDYTEDWSLTQVSEWVDPTEGNGGGDSHYRLVLSFWVPGRKTSILRRVKPGYWKPVYFGPWRRRHPFTEDEKQRFKSAMERQMAEYSRLYHSP